MVRPFFRCEVVMTRILLATAVVGWNLIMFPTNRSSPMDQLRKDPVKLFDNAGIR